MTTCPTTIRAATGLQSVSDAAGQPTSWDAASASFSYDANGNLTSQSGKIADITYDHRNLPTQFELTSGDTVVANYNADGQRILKELKGGAWQFYVMDGQQTLAVIDNNGFSHFNLVGNSTFGRWEPGGTRRYYITDHLGSTRAVTDQNGNIVESYDYYPFGLDMPKRSSTTGNTLEKFTEQEFDEVLNLYWFAPNRYYDPALGRFTGVDPIADDFPHVTPYNYAENSPIRNIDLWGLQAVDYSARYQGLYKASINSGKDPVKYIESYHKAQASNTADFTLTGVSFVVSPIATSVGVGFEAFSDDPDPAAAGTKAATGKVLFQSATNALGGKGKVVSGIVSEIIAGFASRGVEGEEILAPNGIIADGIGGGLGSKFTSNFSDVGGSELTDRMVDLVSIPMGEFAKAIPVKGLNAAEFSSLFKGTPVTRLQPATRGAVNRVYNKAIHKNKNSILLNSMMLNISLIDNDN